MTDMKRNQISSAVAGMAGLALAGALMLACGGTDKKAGQATEQREVATPAASSQAGIAFGQEATGQLFSAYLDLKNALVASDAKAAAAASGRLKEYLDPAGAELATALEATSDLKEQRRLFSELGQALETIFREQISSGTVYKQYCPMAFNNQGGYWFSDSETIRNPYFGDAMLSCGKVEAELKAL